MPSRLWANNPSATLGAAIATTPAAGTQESWSVTVGSTGGAWPTIGVGQRFSCRVMDTGELVDVIGGVTTAGAQTWTVLRGAENSTITTHTSGATLEIDVTASGLGTLFGRAASLLVAASNALQVEKDAADYICDGTSDEVEINAAASALATHGGRILLSSGDFSILAPIRIPTEAVTLEGLGTARDNNDLLSGTRIKIASTAFSGAAAVLVQTTANTSPNFNITLKHFSVEGALIKAGGTTNIDGVQVWACRSLVFDVHVSHMSGAGILCQGYSTAGNALYDTILSHLQVSTCAADGIFLADFASDLHLIGSIVYHNGTQMPGPSDATRTTAGHNLHIRSASSEQITNCHFYDGKNYNIYLEKSAPRCKFLNCKIEGASYHGAVIDGSTAGAGSTDVVFMGCSFADNGDHGLPGTVTNTTIDSSHLISTQFGAAGATNDRLVVIGCNGTYKNDTLGAWGGTPTNYAINLADASAASVMIQGNSFGPGLGSTSPHTAESNTSTTAVSAAGSVAVTLGAAVTDGTLVVGTPVQVDVGNTASETVTVTAIAGTASNVTGFTATFAKAHATTPFKVAWGVNPINVSSSATGIIRDNQGYVTANSGTASIAAAASSVVVTHGLARTPTAQAIFLTPTSDTQGRRWWISAVTATTFTITLDATATTNPVTFGWSAEIL